MKKRGQELSIGTLILIVLGIVVLVLLILGFSLGWQNLWERIGIFTGGSSIESVVAACKISASTGSSASFCSDFKKIRIDGKTQYLNCQDARVIEDIDDPVSCSAKSMTTSCKSLLGDKESIILNGIEVKSCESQVTDQKIIEFDSTEAVAKRAEANKKANEPVIPEEIGLPPA